MLIWRLVASIAIIILDSNLKKAGLQISVSTWKIFSYFSTKTYVVGTEKNCCKEMVLLSTQNTLFKLMDKKINTNLGSNILFILT